MKSCPNCGSESMNNVAGSPHFECAECDSIVYHEGNGFIVDSE